MRSMISRLVFFTTLLLLTLSIPAGSLLAEITKPTATESEQNYPDLDKAWGKIESSKERIIELQKRIRSSEGYVKDLLEARLDRARVSLLEIEVLFIEDVLKKTEASLTGVDIDSKPPR